jgi:hypothetical protein
MEEKSFRLPGSSYAELVKIIRAYGQITGDASPKDVSDRCGVTQTQVSRNNAFLLSIGIVSGGKKKALTSTGRRLAQSLDFEMPEEIESAWREIANDNNALRKIVSAVSIRGGMEPSSLKNHIAYSAGASKTPFVMAGAGSIIDILKAAGLLREQDGKIVVSRAPAVKKPSNKEDEAQQATDSANERLDQKIVKSRTDQYPGGISISIQVRIDCKPNEVKQLGKDLKMILDTLNSDDEKPVDVKPAED